MQPQDHSLNFKPLSIIKNALKLTLEHFWPITTAIFLVNIPWYILLVNGNDTHNSPVSSISQWYYSVVITCLYCGIYQSIYKISDRIRPNVKTIFRNSVGYFSKNFTMGIYVSIHSLCVFVVPAFLIWWSTKDFEQENQDALRGLFILFFILPLCYWWFTRILLARAAVADNASSGREAYYYGLRLTKNKVFKLTPIFSCVAITVTMTTVSGALLYDYLIELGISKLYFFTIFNFFELLIFAPLSTFCSTLIALTYLSLKSQEPPINDTIK